MKIQSFISQYRRDFTAIYECEHCGNTQQGSGYDDDHFHRNVIPNMECKKCNLKAPSDFRPMGTKYSEHEVV